MKPNLKNLDGILPISKEKLIITIMKLVHQLKNQETISEIVPKN
jgi:hypothetical protein